MANYVKITLDTIGPSGVSVLINGDADKITSTAATLTISCSDTDLTGYQMKIWGTAAAPTESDAVWETYQAEKNVTFSSGDGQKTVYVKVRDDVWNESATATDTVLLVTKVPVVTNMTTDVSKISLVQRKDSFRLDFYFDENISTAKVMIVQDVNAPHNAPSNVLIPCAAGSVIYHSDTDFGDEIETDYLELTNGEYSSTGYVTCSIYAEDITSVAPGDGVKIIKAYVKSAATGSWSI